MAHVLLSDIVDVITAQYDEEPDSYVHGVGRTLVISHAKRVLQELSYAGMRSLRVAISEVYASGKVELPDDYVEYVKVYYCVGNYLVPAFWNPHINTAQWEGIKDFETEVIQTATGRTIYTESGDYLAVMVRSGERVKDYGNLHCNCFLKGYKYDDKNNCFVFDYIPDGVTHVAIEYVADPLMSEPNPDNLGVHKFFQKAIEAGVYLRLVETRRNVPMNEKVRAKREWNIKYKDAVKELNAKPWEYVQVIMGWRHMRRCGFEGMGGQHVPENIVEKADYCGRYEEFVCQKTDIAEYSGKYDGFVCQRIEVEDLPEYVGRYSEFVCQKVNMPDDDVYTIKMISLASTANLDIEKGDGEVTIDWGDGSVESVSALNIKHTYSDGKDEHDIIIRGNVTGLICSNNQLTSLDVSQDVVLKKLDCFGNQLTSLDLSKNLKLVNVDGSVNQLTLLDVSHNPALDYLHCEDNLLTSLNISGCEALRDLCCSYNKIDSLDASQCQALDGLYCGNNQLTSLNVSGCTALKILDCNNSQLTSLDVSGNPALGDLHCYDNQLASLEVSHNPELKVLNCRNNPLERGQDSVLSLVNSLPDRTSMQVGSFYIIGKNYPGDTNALSVTCNQKNWRLYF